MASPAQEPRSIDHFFSAPSGRTDRWRDLHAAARSWSTGDKSRRVVEVALNELGVIEEFHAFPGVELLATLRGFLQNDDANGFLSLAKRISLAIITGNYKHDPKEWQSADLSLAEPVDVVPSALGDNATHRPYFEMLLVTPAPAGRWPHIAAEFRRLRRPEDAFIYEVVPVGSLEDAICAAVLNPNIAAVAIYEGFALRSRHDASILRSVLAAQQPLLDKADEADMALRLSAGLKAIRPELDIYLLSDRRVEKLAGDPRAAMIRRVMYQVEEPLELHLSVLEGIKARYDTPFFDNLKLYAQRPVATFHALPIARGKSVFRSPWIRDMGQFYGINLFLAESSATTGGLDSLLEPTGNIKRAQEMAARAFGADHVFFVTNGTSTSNKMVLQALIAPGDIVILDRNCHKSHHYGLVLSGAQPVYVEAFPMTEYSMYGAVPLRTIKKALLDLKAEDRLDRVKMVDLTNCTFDGHIYNTRRVMEECLAIKPDLIFLWDEAWFGFARWSPFLRPRTAMGAATDIEAWMESPDALAAYERQRKELGASPSAQTLLDTRLIPDPRAVRLRVYQTNSTHKSMSAIRQGSMVLVRDVDFHKVEAQFHEAVFTHASTSPNQQLIASLDVARRQMEIEGYGLVMNAIEVALDIRREIAIHPLISKYFKVVGADGMVPAQYRTSGFVDFLAPETRWDDQLRSMREDEFCLDPTRMTLVCGTAGFDGTSFKGLLASQYGIQVNKTSRNSVLLQSNINNTRSDVALLISVLFKISNEIEDRLRQGGDGVRRTFEARVRSLMTDVPELPDFSHFHEAFRGDAGKNTPEGDIRTAFFSAYAEDKCEYLPIDSPECDRRIDKGPALISANFVIPYPPGFPILVPGQVVTHETITFMRKLDVKEIHGYEKAKGLKLLRPDALTTKKK
ncbi:Arginine decarboxylase OS=Bosea thiooxidans OX=53254 GN=SAMN05660750_03413 PE=4 SV=1 [Bosea thiooxidans]|uniref:Arginine decarboxylase n=1 Tax=Bosea thiooxidans TaxID=53254 RepID=A0A1T5FNK4_9HYPH|nr:beta-eliminating lyase-related protein [Bosea thiooxidans]SKB97759.1 arginine decarboxylase [Bosea thiooxidans]